MSIPRGCEKTWTIAYSKWHLQPQVLEEGAQKQPCCEATHRAMDRAFDSDVSVFFLKSYKTTHWTSKWGHSFLPPLYSSHHSESHADHTDVLFKHFVAQRLHRRQVLSNIAEHYHWGKESSDIFLRFLLHMLSKRASAIIHLSLQCECNTPTSIVFGQTIQKWGAEYTKTIVLLVLVFRERDLNDLKANRGGGE